MFVNFELDKFPLVLVKFGSTISGQEDLDIFFNQWLQFYQDRKHFTYLLDTSECGKIGISYCRYIAKNISQIKKEKEHFLERTIVIISSKWITYLMKFLFTLIKPVAPVYIVQDSETALELYDRLQKNLLKSDLKYDFYDNK